MKFLKFLVAGLAFLSASAVSATPISMVGTWIGHRGGTGTVEFVIDDTVFQTASPNAVNWFDPMVASNFFFSGQLWNGASFYEAYDPEPGIWHLTFQWTAPIDPYIDLMSQPQMLAFTLNSYTSSKYDYLKTEVWVSGQGSEVFTLTSLIGTALPAVPVPASLPLMAAGIGALAALRRRKKAA